MEAEQISIPKLTKYQLPLLMRIENPLEGPEVLKNIETQLLMPLVILQDCIG